MSFFVVSKGYKDTFDGQQVAPFVKEIDSMRVAVEYAEAFSSRFPSRECYVTSPVVLAVSSAGKVIQYKVNSLGERLPA